MAKELLKRSEVKEEYTWNLKDMYASDEVGKKIWMRLTRSWMKSERWKVK